MNPGSHCQLCDEDVTAFREENRGFRRDHLDFGVGLHDLLDSGQRELMDFEIMGVSLQMIDCLLPIRSQNLSGSSCQALIDLLK